MRLLLALCLAPPAFPQYYIASTIAGNGQLPPLSSGAAATIARLVSLRYVAAEALLTNPGALAFDSAGNLYIADVANARIRRQAQVLYAGAVTLPGLNVFVQ
jgi:hypothetical protein